MKFHENNETQSNFMKTMQIVLDLKPKLNQTMTLTEKQIDFIADDLENRGLTFDDLRAELVDHVCCMVEEEMEVD